jgi:hypothetical protein
MYEAMVSGIMALACIAVLAALIIVNRDRLRKNKGETALLVVATAIALVFETGLHIGQYLQRP